MKTPNFKLLFNFLMFLFCHISAKILLQNFLLLPPKNINFSFPVGRIIIKQRYIRRENLFILYFLADIPLGPAMMTSEAESGRWLVSEREGLSDWSVCRRSLVIGRSVLARRCLIGRRIFEKRSDRFTATDVLSLCRRMKLSFLFYPFWHSPDSDEINEAVHPQRLASSYTNRSFASELPRSKQRVSSVVEEEILCIKVASSE